MDIAKILVAAAVLGVACSGDDDSNTTPTMDGVPGDAVCIPEGLWHSSVQIRLCCERGDGGQDDVCQGNVASTNPNIGLTTRDVGGIGIPEDQCAWVQLDSTATGVGQRADIVVQDLDCAIANGCPTGFQQWSCPQCEFTSGKVEVCN